MAEDVSPPPVLQWFESPYETIQARSADLFMAGYGAVWLPPPGRADTGDQSVGYDVFDRFDLGGPGRPTLYGTETGLASVADTLHRAGADLQIDYVINHNGFRDQSTPGFVQAGGYPGLAVTLPEDIDGDFHSAFDSGDVNGRLAGLIDIAHEKNHVYIRNPVTPGDPRNLPPAGAGPGGANVPSEDNRRFYPDIGHETIYVFDPSTGEGDIPIHRFNLPDPLAGDPVPENAMGYLMRYAQWMVQVIGVDGFRIDAAKHMPGFVLDYFDRAVYRSNPRTLLDGATKHVFSYSEVFDSSRPYQQTFVKKTINPSEIGVVGGNRDVLDFPLFFALRQNLTGNDGPVNNWYAIRDAGMDAYDDGMHNGSQGVMFVGSHDQSGPFLSSVAHAYMLMHPGNAVVYYNGRQFGDNRDFPKDGRGDALGGVYGDAIRTLVEIRNTHGRGNYIERWIEKEIFAFERAGSAITLLSNRLDAGYDSRTLQTTFAPGTPLVELTGTSSDPAIDPRDDIPSLLVVNGDGTVNVRFLRNSSFDANMNSFFHGSGYLVYGLAGPQAPGGLELAGVDSVLAGGNPAPNAQENGRTRLTDLYVVKGDSLGVRLQTVPVRLLGSYRDPSADGDNALLRLDGGRDLNGNGVVDFVTPGQVAYGFERFGDKSSPLIGPSGPGDPGYHGDGEFRQTIDTTQLEEGVHFLEARAFRHRTDGGPAVYSSFKKVLYVDRLPPESAVQSFEPWDSAHPENRDLVIRSVDKTADKVRVFLNLPAAVTDAEILQRAGGGEGAAARIDRDLFRYGFFGVPGGNNVATVVTFETSGTASVRRDSGLFITGGVGRGLGDVNFDGAFTPSDLAGAPGAFEQVLWSRNGQFNPAGDTTGDGLIDVADLLGLGEVLAAGGADAPTMATWRDVMVRRVDFNTDGAADVLDLNDLVGRFGRSDWLRDLDSDGTVSQADADMLVHQFDVGLPESDIDADGVVDDRDLSLLLSDFGKAGISRATDVTRDGMVDQRDLSLVLAHFGATAASTGPLSVVPEPSAMILALVGLVGFLAPGLFTSRRRTVGRRAVNNPGAGTFRGRRSL